MWRLRSDLFEVCSWKLWLYICCLSLCVSLQVVIRVYFFISFLKKDLLLLRHVFELYCKLNTCRSLQSNAFEIWLHQCYLQFLWPSAARPWMGGWHSVEVLPLCSAQHSVFFLALARLLRCMWERPITFERKYFNILVIFRSSFTQAAWGKACAVCDSSLNFTVCIKPGP